MGTKRFWVGDNTIKRGLRHNEKAGRARQRAEQLGMRQTKSILGELDLKVRRENFREINYKTERSPREIRYKFKRTVCAAFATMKIYFLTYC